MQKITDDTGQAADILFIHALTGLHPGSGHALGVVDLPVQRERHTQWPVIPGSTLKGVLRDKCRENVKDKYDGVRKKANGDPNLIAVFGPGEIDGNASAFSGALSIADARILAFPVRSLKGVFAWVTCPAVLERLHRDLGIARRVGTLEWKVRERLGKDKGKALCAESPLTVSGEGGKKMLVLEEFDFERIGDANDIADWVSEYPSSDPATKDRIKSNLVILHDDDFTHFVRHATEVTARIGLDYERKTAKSGALFYQEFLPAETIFYAVMLATGSRPPKKRDDDKDSGGNSRPAEMNASDVIGYAHKALAHSNGSTLSVIQIGGDETIGRGLCAVRFMNGAKGEK